MIASIPWLQSALNFFLNRIFVCLGRSQIFELFHPCKGTIFDFYIVISFCILISRHGHVLSFYGEELEEWSAPRPNPSWRTTPCWMSANVYSVYSQLTSVLETVPPSAAWGRAMSWWQGPTYHGMLLLIRSKFTQIFKISSTWMDTSDRERWYRLRCPGSVANCFTDLRSFVIGDEYTRSFQCPTDKNVKNWGPANVGSLPWKFKCFWTYIHMSYLCFCVPNSLLGFD
jgi:hypothetical protein